ncbi:response regulator [Candidatus Woesearchaeota archaeon]|nr:response regulator [Candidatus Woesearchaeota archaeon]
MAIKGKKYRKNEDLMEDLEAKVLIVDDDKNMRALLKERLEDCRSKVAANGESALKLMDESEFYVAVVDINMPKMDGKKLIRRFEKKKKKTDVIVVSGDDYSDLLNEHESVIAFYEKSDIEGLEKLVRKTVKKRWQNEQIVQESKRIYKERVAGRENKESTDDETNQDWLQAESNVLKRILVYTEEKSGEKITKELDKVLRYNIKHVSSKGDAEEEIEKGNYDLIFASPDEGRYLMEILDELELETPIIYRSQRPNAEVMRDAFTKLRAAQVITSRDDIIEGVSEFFYKQKPIIEREQEEKEKADKREECYKKITPYLTWPDKEFTSREELDLIAFAVKEGLLKSTLLESPDGPDNYAVGLASARELDKKKQYDVDKIFIGTLEHAQGEGYPIEVAEQLQLNYELFQDTPGFNVPKVMPLIVDKERGVGYVRREFIIGPTVAEVLLSIRERSPWLFDMNDSPEQRQQKLKNVMQLKKVLINKSLRNLVFWQRMTEPERPSKTQCEELREHYADSLAKAVETFEKYADLNISSSEVAAFRKCASVFADRFAIEKSTFSVKMDSTPWNMVLKTGKIDMSLEEIVNYFKGEDGNIDAEKIEDTFYHTDLGSDSSQIYSCILEDFWHFVDSYEANIKGEKIQKNYYLFLLEKAKEREKEGSMKRDILERIISEVKQDKLPTDIYEVREKVSSFDKSNEEGRIYRNIRKAALELEVYGFRNHKKHEEGNRDYDKFIERQKQHKEFIMHHTKLAAKYARVREESEFRALQEIFKLYDPEEVGMINEGFKEYTELRENLSSNNTVTFGKFVNSIEEKIEQSDNSQYKNFAKELINLANLKYIHLMLEKISHFNQDISIDYTMREL